MKKGLLKHLLCGLAIFGLCACSVISPAQPLRQLVLSPRMHKSAEGPRIAVQLGVAQVESYSALNTARVAVINRREIQYLPDVSWASPVPRVVQNLLVRGISDTRRLSGVGSEQSGGLTEYQLFSFLNAFEVLIEEDGAPHVRVGLDLKLIGTGGRALDYVSVSATSPAASMDVADLLDAFEAATGDALTQATDWTLAAIERDAP